MDITTEQASIILGARFGIIDEMTQPVFSKAGCRMKEYTQWLRLTTPASDRALSILVGASCVLALTAVCLQIVSRPLDFDESLHAHYLWLVSIGRIPHVDFWCHYPALGYTLVLPYFRLLPESILSLIPLRLFGLCLLTGVGVALCAHARHLGARWVWGVLPLAIVMGTPEAGSLVAEFRTDAYAAVPAVLALTIMFREPAPWRSGLAASLSVLSVMIMPKHVYPLALASLTYLAFGCVKLKPVRRSLIMAFLGGALIGLVFSQLVLLRAGVRLWNDAYWSSIFMQRYSLHCAVTENEKSLQTTFSYVLGYFSRYWWVAVILLVGIAGWLRVESKQGGVRFWVGIAMIAGVVLFWWTCPWPYRQYLVPGLFCLLLFMPYAGILASQPFLQGCLILFLALLSAQMSLGLIRAGTVELASGDLWADLRSRQRLLDSIPRSERVVGLGRTHPCFREDQTFVTWDDKWGMPGGFTPLLPQDSAEARCFLPEYLAKSLEQSPPASVALREQAYPPGWNQVIGNFLRCHSEEYQKLQLRGDAVFIRKDLLNDSLKSLPRPSN